MRINDLKQLVKGQLLMLKNRFPDIVDVYYQLADEDDLYPHIVFDFPGNIMNAEDLAGRTITLDVDIWDRQISSYLAEEMADAVEDLLNNKNLPQERILPTFYLETRTPVREEDPRIKHIVVRFSIDMYERR